LTICPASALALAQRRLRADHREHAAHDINHRRAGAQRLAGRSGHIGEPGHKLHHFIERRTVLVGPAQKTFQRAIDQPRIPLRQIGVAAAQPVHGAGCVVFQNEVGGGRQPVEQGPALVGFQIDGEAALVAVEGQKKSRGKADAPPRRVAVGRFDLDHVGAEVGEDQARRWAHDGVAEFEHANAGKRQGLARLGISISCRHRPTRPLISISYVDGNLIS